MSDITFVTGLWDINRGAMDNTAAGHDWKRGFDKYTRQLEQLLSTGLSIVVYADDETVRGMVARYPTATFCYYSKDNFRSNFKYYERINTIRTSKEWYDQPTARWLKSSPQAVLDLYAPIQLSKILFVEKTIESNPYNSSRFYWLDAGITKNHDVERLRTMVPNLMKYSKFMFFSHLYTDNTEIHGFLREAAHKYCSVQFIDRIMKGFFWGGPVERFNEIISLYHAIVEKSLEENLLGVDETILTIMAYQRPDLFDKVLIKDCANVMRFL
jgi:hypothetical protein